MAFSLESRAPIMDYRIVEFGRTLPTDYKFLKGNKKRILKDLLRQYLPNELIERPKKGFGVPVGMWFRNELRELVRDTLTEDYLETIPNLNVPVVLKNIAEHDSGKQDFSRVIFTLLVLAQWQKQQKALTVNFLQSIF